MLNYKTHGTCSTNILVDVDGDTVRSVEFVNGCAGNTQGVARLVAGRNVDEVIALLQDVKCRGNTSCPAQLAQALKQIKAQSNG